MTRVEQLETEVQKLSLQELSAFRAWFVEYDWRLWDAQLERDVAEGKLDRFAAEALKELDCGETSEL